MVKTTLDEWISMYFDRETGARDGAGPAGTALSSVDKFREDVEEIATAWAAPRDEGHTGIRKHLLNMVDTEDRGCSSESNLESLSSAMSRAIRKRAIDGVLERALLREAHEAGAAERQMRLCGIDDEAGAASGEKKTQPSGSAWMLAAAPYMAPASRVRLLAELAESSRDRLLRELAQCSRERLLRELQLDTSSQGARVPARRQHTSASTASRPGPIPSLRPGSHVASS